MQPQHEPVPSDKPGEPTWRVALFYPRQGGWTETDYLELDGGPLVEFDKGTVEILDMPSKEHQRVVRFLFLLLQSFVESSNIGEVFFAPLPVRLWPEKFREPDILFVRDERAEYRGYPDGADLVIEVVSPDAKSRRRDTEIKPEEYARAGIAEYWIVDTELQTIQVLSLEAGKYESSGTFTPGQEAQSVCLTGFSVAVNDVLAAAHRVS